jgi:hypothetical protein
MQSRIMEGKDLTNKFALTLLAFGKRVGLQVAARAYVKAWDGLPVKPHGVHEAAVPPWLASVSYDAPEHGRYDRYQAAGALISDRVVVTSANVFDDSATPGGIPFEHKQFTVQVGGVGPDGGELRRVQHVIRNPGFHLEYRPFRPATGDMALLVLDRPVDLPVLPCADVKPAPGSLVSVLSWSLGIGDQPNGVRRFDTSIIHPLSCTAGSLTEKDLCAANLPLPQGMGPQFGGSPVVQRDTDGSPRLVGIVSRGVRISTKTGGQPAIFTGIAGNREFLDQTIATYTSADKNH